jgi:mRNA interferase MazF
MPSTTTYKRGDLVLVAFPFTNLASLKRRPALVVSPDPFNHAMQDLVLVAITSQVTDDGRLTIDAGDCIEGGLPKKSVVKPTKLFTMHATLVLKKLGTLRPEKLETILGDLRAFFS